MIFFITSCNYQKGRGRTCLTKITYRDSENSFNFPVIKVDFFDVDTLIGKKIREEQYNEVIFYALGSDSGKLFWSKPGYYEHSGDTTSLFFSVSYFVTEDAEGPTPDAIERFLANGGVRLISGQDTTNLVSCQVL